MASSDDKPVPTPASAGGGAAPPGQPTTVASKVLDMGAAAMQSLQPVKQVKQHVCTFALYAHDPKRQLETHHYVSRLNQDFLQCAVYDSDAADARLIGVEYIVSRKVFDTLPAEEQRLWHSHAHEITAGLWASPRVPGMLEKPELDHLASTLGKFWWTAATTSRWAPPRSWCPRRPTPPPPCAPAWCGGATTGTASPRRSSAWAGPTSRRPPRSTRARPTTGSATARGSPSTWCRTR